jgi:hypothetical protein
MWLLQPLSPSCSCLPVPPRETYPPLRLQINIVIQTDQTSRIVPTDFLSAGIALLKLGRVILRYGDLF